MQGRILGNITNPALVSRFDRLAVKVDTIIDSAVHGAGERLIRGTLLALGLAGGGAAPVNAGKSVAYAEGATGATAFSNASINFSISIADPTDKTAYFFRPGMRITKLDGTLVGTVATFDPTTGLGTLTGDAAVNVATGLRVQLSAVDYGVDYINGGLLEDDVAMDGTHDEPVSMFIEGFFNKAGTSLTAQAITAMGAKSFASGEVRLSP
jgi:hypothetical protein